MVVFADEVMKLASEAEFILVARQSMEEILGVSLASAVVKSMGSEFPEDPRIFEEKVRVALGPAADRIFEYILEKLVLKGLENVSKGLSDFTASVA